MTTGLLLVVLTMFSSSCFAQAEMEENLDQLAAQDCNGDG